MIENRHDQTHFHFEFMGLECAWRQARSNRMIACMDQENLSMTIAKQYPLNALKVFEAAARHLSFTRAGEELGMTQAAVSYQIKLLEDNVGEPLFLRRPRQVALTQAGERLAPKVSEAFAMLADALAGLRDQSEGRLTIHTTATFASHWLAHHIGTFHDRKSTRLNSSHYCASRMPS